MNWFVLIPYGTKQNKAKAGNETEDHDRSQQTHVAEKEEDDIDDDQK